MLPASTMPSRKSEEKYRVVQFLHGGPERIPDSPDGKSSSWNNGAIHYRRFVARRGSFRKSPTSSSKQMDIGFWCEWEPQARVISRVPEEHRKIGDPRYIYEPYYNLRGVKVRRSTSNCGDGNDNCMNTDPFVFGDRFYYSNCHQGAYSTLRNLERGSVILFGSRVGGRFALDTVFVVDVVCPITTGGELRRIRREVPSVLDDVTLQTIPDSGLPLTLYGGATPDAPVGGMFSFVPAAPMGTPLRGFPRPSLEIEGAISQGKTQGVKYARVPDSALYILTPDEGRPIWNRVAEQVMEAGLGFGFNIMMPEREG